MGLQTELVSTSEIVEKAEKIYAERHRQACERDHLGAYAVIDLTDGAIYIGEFAEIAFEKAKESSPKGIFHLIRIGAPSAFNLGFLGSQYVNVSAGGI